MHNRLIPKRLQAFPQISEKNWLNHAMIVDFLSEAVAQYATGTLVDVGCGVKPYARIVAPFVDHHIGVDTEESPHGTTKVDVLGTAYATGLEDAMCESVLCTEVLEHLERPADAAQEFYRILKPTGVVILTTPFFWPVHEAPRDFYRYSEYGLRYLFEGAGFEIVEVRPLTGYIVTFTQLSIYYLKRFQRGPFLRMTGDLVNFAAQHLAYRLNRYDHSYAYTNLYGLVARKRQGD